jgi:hypothetical protein
MTLQRKILSVELNLMLHLLQPFSIGDITIAHFYQTRAILHSKQNPNVISVYGYSFSITVIVCCIYKINL